MKKQTHDKSNWLVAAGLFIGIGLGLITRQVWGYTLIGFGAGLSATYLISRKKK